MNKEELEKLVEDTAKSITKLHQRTVNDVYTFLEDRNAGRTNQHGALPALWDHEGIYQRLSIEL